MSEFQDDISIDPNALDIEACRQAETYFKWGEKSAEAKEDVEKAELQKDVLEAELSSQIREDPTKFGLPKVTDKAVDTAVRRHPSYIEAQKTCIEARKTYTVLTKAETAMSHKKRMITDLVQLHGQQYFAGPSVPRDLAKAYMEFNKNRGARVNAKQGKKVRNRKKE